MAEASVTLQTIPPSAARSQSPIHQRKDGSIDAITITIPLLREKDSYLVVKLPADTVAEITGYIQELPEKDRNQFLIKWIIQNADAVLDQFIRTGAKDHQFRYDVVPVLVAPTIASTPKRAETQDEIVALHRLSSTMDPVIAPLGRMGAETETPITAAMILGYLYKIRHLVIAGDEGGRLKTVFPSPHKPSQKVSILPDNASSDYVREGAEKLLEIVDGLAMVDRVISTLETRHLSDDRVLFEYSALVRKLSDVKMGATPSKIGLIDEDVPDKLAGINISSLYGIGVLPPLIKAMPNITADQLVLYPKALATLVSTCVDNGVVDKNKLEKTRAPPYYKEAVLNLLAYMFDLDPKNSKQTALDILGIAQADFEQASRFNAVLSSISTARAGGDRAAESAKYLYQRIPENNAILHRGFRGLWNRNDAISLSFAALYESEAVKQMIGAPEFAELKAYINMHNGKLGGAPTSVLDSANNFIRYCISSTANNDRRFFAELHQLSSERSSSAPFDSIDLIRVSLYLRRYANKKDDKVSNLPLWIAPGQNPGDVAKLMPPEPVPTRTQQPSADLGSQKVTKAPHIVGHDNLELGKIPPSPSGNWKLMSDEDAEANKTIQTRAAELVLMLRGKDPKYNIRLGDRIEETIDGNKYLFRAQPHFNRDKNGSGITVYELSPEPLVTPQPAVPIPQPQMDESNLFAQALTRNPKSSLIIAFGDSIGKGSAYANALETALRPIFPNLSIDDDEKFNRGGNKLEFMAGPAFATALAKNPSVIIVQGGYNDLAPISAKYPDPLATVPIEKLRSQVTSMIDRAQAAKIPIIFMTVPPTKTNGDPRFYANVHRFNELLMLQNNPAKGVYVLDCNPLLGDGSNPPRLKQEYYSSINDGIHPGPNAGVVIAAKLRSLFVARDPVSSTAKLGGAIELGSGGIDTVGFGSGVAGPSSSSQYTIDLWDEALKLKDGEYCMFIMVNNMTVAVDIPKDVAEDSGFASLTQTRRNFSSYIGDLIKDGKAKIVGAFIGSIRDPQKQTSYSGATADSGEAIRALSTGKSVTGAILVFKRDRKESSGFKNTKNIIQ